MALKTYATISPDGDFPVGEPSKTYAAKVVNQNGGEYVRFWFGTEEEFESLEIIEEDVCYNILEDVVET